MSRTFATFSFFLPVVDRSWFEKIQWRGVIKFLSRHSKTSPATKRTLDDFYSPEQKFCILSSSVILVYKER